MNNEICKICAKHTKYTCLPEKNGKCDAFESVLNDEGYIKKEHLKDFCAYLCNARNFKIGIWHNNEMYYLRHKFGDSFIDSEYHWDDGSENCGTCKPLKQISNKLDRLDDNMFRHDNWRGQIVLSDVLSVFDALTINEGEF